MFGQNGFRPMGAQALRMAPMNGHASVHMGQAASSAAAWWPAEGLATVQTWDSLISRVSKLTNPEAQAQILDWIGRSDLPTSPAERYKVVVDALNSNASPVTDDEINTLRKRLDVLKSFTIELEGKVKNAEQTYGVFAASTGAASTPERDMMMVCVAAGIALSGLIILPLISD